MVERFGFESPRTFEEMLVALTGVFPNGGYTVGIYCKAERDEKPRRAFIFQTGPPRKCKRAASIAELFQLALAKAAAVHSDSMMELAASISNRRIAEYREGGTTL